MLGISMVQREHLIQIVWYTRDSQSRFGVDQKGHAGIASGIIETLADFAPMGCYLSFLGTQRNSS